MENNYRRAVANAGEWVTAVEIVHQKNENKGAIRDGWFNIGSTQSVEECLRDSGSFGKAVDLNTWAGGEYLYGIFKTTSDKSKAIEDFLIMTTSNKDQKPPAGYERYPLTLNYSVTGPYIYLCYKPVTKDSKTAVKWLGGVAFTVKTTNLTPYEDGVVRMIDRDNGVRWISAEANGGDNKNPVDVNKNVWYSQYVYLTQEKVKFEW